MYFILDDNKTYAITNSKHCVKFASIRIFSDPCFPFYRKIRVRKNPYSGIFYAVKDVIARTGSSDFDISLLFMVTVFHE